MACPLDLLEECPLAHNKACPLVHLEECPPECIHLTGFHQIPYRVVHLAVSLGRLSLHDLYLVDHIVVALLLDLPLEQLAPLDPHLVCRLALGTHQTLVHLQWEDHLPIDILHLL
jgi:hypothetical protein